jgi:hypothetical protein
VAVSEYPEIDPEKLREWERERDLEWEDIPDEGAEEGGGEETVERRDKRILKRPLLDEKGRFIWTDEREEAARLLAENYTNGEVAKRVGVSSSTITNWKKLDEFDAEVDKLSLIYGAASKAERMRLITKAARQFVKENGEIDTGKDSLLDYLREARMQTEGMRLGILETITAIEQATGLVTDSGPDRNLQLPEPKEAEAE